MSGPTKEQEAAETLAILEGPGDISFQSLDTKKTYVMKCMTLKYWDKIADRLSTADELFEAQEAFSEYANREHSYSTSEWMVEWNKLKKAVGDTYDAYLKARETK